MIAVAVDVGVVHQPAHRADAPGRREREPAVEVALDEAVGLVVEVGELAARAPQPEPLGPRLVCRVGPRSRLLTKNCRFSTTNTRVPTASHP